MKLATTFALFTAMTLAIPGAIGATMRSSVTIVGQRTNQSRVIDAEGVMLLETIPQNEVVSDKKLLDSIKGKLTISGPGDYLLGHGFRLGYSVQWEYDASEPPFLYVVADFKAFGADGKYEVATALPWPPGMPLQIPPRLFAGLIKDSGDHTVIATFNFLNATGDALLKAGVAQLDGTKLRFPTPRQLNADGATALLKAFGEDCPHHQLIAQSEVQAIADINSYFKIIPPSPELDEKLKKSLEGSFTYIDNIPACLPLKLDCNILAHVEYQLKSDQQWKYLYWATIGGGSWACLGKSPAAIPPETSELKLRFLPFSPEEAWAKKSDMREYYGGTIETDWLKLDAADND